MLRAEGIEVDGPEYVARTAWTTDELQDAIDEAKPRAPYDLVTLLVGVNDQYRARPAKTFAATFQDVLKRAIVLAGRRAARVIVLSIPDWGATPYAAGRDAAGIGRDVDAYNELARAAVVESGAAWVDVTTLSRRMLSEPSFVVEDGLHPSGALYAEWARLAAPAALIAVRSPARSRRRA